MPKNPVNGSDGTRISGRVGSVSTRTKETKISVNVNLDGSGKASISTGVRFLDHMLSAFSTHSLIDITISASGDLRHHVIEDTALALGSALSKALGERKGIMRFGSAFVPMDESLACVHLDLAKRTHLVLREVEFSRDYIEDIAKEDLKHFFRSLCDSFSCAMHIEIMYGSNDHHKAEAVFKSLALAMRTAVSVDPRRPPDSVPSSKGKM